MAFLGHLFNDKTLCQKSVDDNIAGSAILTNWAQCYKTFFDRNLRILQLG